MTFFRGAFSKSRIRIPDFINFHVNPRSFEELRATSCSVLVFFLFSFSTRHLPRCQIGVLAGLLSTSHFRLTDIPSTIGIPKPGKRVIANDGVSETGIKQLMSVPMSMCTGVSKISRKHRKETRV